MILPDTHPVSTDNHAQGNIQILNELFTANLEPVMGAFDLYPELTIEPARAENDIYSVDGAWAWRHPINFLEKKTKLVISRNALEVLNPDAVEGLVCHQLSEMLLVYRAKKEGQVSLIEMLNKPPAEQEVMIDNQQRIIFDVRRIVPFRCQTAEYDLSGLGAKLDRGIYLDSFGSYLLELGKYMPRLAWDIVTNVSFYNELNLRRQS